MTENTNIIPFEEQLRRELAGLKDNLPPPSSNKIKTKGKLFTLPSGESSPGPLNAIVLDYIQQNELYPGAYNPKNPQRPICFALNKVIEELAPSPKAPSPKSTSCSTCPHDKWGSAPNGKGKACKNQWKLVLVSENFTITDEPLTLFVSPSGMKHWTKYVRDLAQIHGLLPVQVITEISFEPTEAYPTLLFKMIGPHGRLQDAMTARQRAQELLLREPDIEKLENAAA